MSINTNPSELGTISTNVTSILEFNKEVAAAIAFSSDSTKTQLYRVYEEQGAPWIYSNTGTAPVVIFPTSKVNTDSASAGIAIVNTSSFTNALNTATTSSDLQHPLYNGTEDFQSLPNHKRLKLSINNASVTHHPAVKYNQGLVINGVFGSSLELRAVHTNTTFTIPYSSTTSPIFISYATNTDTLNNAYGSFPFAWNPVYKTIAIAGATNTATTYTGLAGTIPSTVAVTHFEYDFSESITKYNLMNILSSTITATHKGHLNISTTWRTSTDGRFDIAWSTDGKYLAAIVGVNAVTTSASQLVVASMDTSTKILTSVATASFASENNASYSVCWSGNSQIFIGGAFYSAGNDRGILYSFNTSTNALTLGTFPAGIDGAGTAPAGIDRFDNGDLLVKIAGSNTSTTGFKIYKPSTSATISANVRSIFPSILSTHTPTRYAVTGEAYGTNSELHPIVYMHHGGSGSGDGLIAMNSSTAGMSVFLYDSDAGTISGVYSTNIGRTSAFACPAVRPKTKYGFISCAMNTGSATQMYSPSGINNSSQVSGVVALGDMRNFTDSSILGPTVYLHSQAMYTNQKYLLEPGQTAIISSRDGHFFGATQGNTFTALSMAVQEVE